MDVFSLDWVFRRTASYQCHYRKILISHKRSMVLMSASRWKHWILEPAQYMNYFNVIRDETPINHGMNPDWNFAVLIPAGYAARQGFFDFLPGFLCSRIRFK